MRHSRSPLQTCLAAILITFGFAAGSFAAASSPVVRTNGKDAASALVLWRTDGRLGLNWTVGDFSSDNLPEIIQSNRVGSPQLYSAPFSKPFVKAIPNRRPKHGALDNTLRPLAIKTRDMGLAPSPQAHSATSSDVGVAIRFVSNSVRFRGPPETL